MASSAYTQCTIHGINRNKLHAPDMEAMGSKKIVWTTDHLATRGWSHNAFFPLCSHTQELLFHLLVESVLRLGQRGGNNGA
uniref:Uncharacterized protein n=1 Tax=Oryza punctata TaxID=4537 RepID=A0A0E0M215_ORYPU